MTPVDEPPEPDASEAVWGAVAPAPLVAAAGLAAVQGLLVVLGAVAELLAGGSGRWLLASSTAVFFGLYGAALLGCAWGLYRVRPWTRGPVLLAQLVWLGLAWNLRESWPLAAGLVVAAAAVLAGLLHPRSMAALEGARDGS